MKKYTKISLKKIRNKKNKNLSNKSAILGNKRLVGRYYNGGDARYISINSLKLGALLQFNNLKVTNKVGWLLVQTYFRGYSAYKETVSRSRKKTNNQFDKYKKIYNIR